MAQLLSRLGHAVGRRRVRRLVAKRSDRALPIRVIVGVIAAMVFPMMPETAATTFPASRESSSAFCPRGDVSRTCTIGDPRRTNVERLSLTKRRQREADTARKAVAAQPPDEWPSAVFLVCMDRAGGVTSAMLDCGHAEIVRVDARLNAAYRRLMTTLPAAEAERLRASQRLWLRRHLAETRRLAGAPDTGSMAFVESQRFELQDLGERAIVLERKLAMHR